MKVSFKILIIVCFILGQRKFPRKISIHENIKEIFISYPKYKELKITIGDDNNLGKITLLKRGCKK